MFTPISYDLLVALALGSDNPRSVNSDQPAFTRVFPKSRDPRHRPSPPEPTRIASRRRTRLRVRRVQLPVLPEGVVGGPAP